ncbi:hypothetical protein [Bacillus sp. 1P06AnD]|uniref:hypothetical protein n=1 Tax=Bacillus sp. 1P06AnD TaxID=3132208 RepID=UPI0039A15D14
MHLIQIIMFIWIAAFILVLLLSMAIKKWNLDIEKNIIGKILASIIIVIAYIFFIIPLTIMSFVGVIGMFIFLIVLCGFTIIALIYAKSYLATYIIVIAFSICLAYFAPKAYNVIFFMAVLWLNNPFTRNLCNRLKNILDKFNYRIITYIILLIIYITKNCLLYSYDDLESMTIPIIGFNLSLNNLVTVSNEALLTFVIIDTIVTNSEKLKKVLRLNN